jgi:hypothetical protein
LVTGKTEIVAEREKIVLGVEEESGATTLNLMTLRITALSALKINISTFSIALC